MSLNLVGRNDNLEVQRTQTTFVMLAMLALTAVSFGCVRRRLLLRTNPAGASVYVDKQLIGTTPTASSFTYYGTREIEVVADGFRTEKVLRTLSPPWYQIPPLDFISESLWPWELRDERVVDITLVPEQSLASEVLQARADNLRLQAAQGIATPAFQPIRPAPAVDVPSNFPNLPETTTLPPVSAFDGPPPQTSGPVWIPGQALQNFVRPGGQPPQRIPETGILPGGGFRPEVPNN